MLPSNQHIDVSLSGGYNLLMNQSLLKPKNLPNKPGVYFFKDSTGQVLYIGKAKNLRARISQYFGKNDGRPQIPFLMAEAAQLDYTLVATELESLYLERNLIQQYRPRYNIELKDDKNFAFITIDYNQEIPQIGYVRKFDPNQKNIVYFGPYTAAGKIRDILNTIRKIFAYCGAKKFNHQPCFYYHLHRCPGVCVGKISLQDYRRHVQQIEKFLSGQTEKILKQLKTKMRAAARGKKFETAARLRDEVKSLELVLQKQNVILTKPVNWDIIAVAEEGFFKCVTLFKLRNGRLTDKEAFVYETRQTGAKNTGYGEVLQKFLEDYYLAASDLPREIITDTPVDNPILIQKLLTARSGRKIKITLAQKGKPKALLQLSEANAREHLNRWLTERAGNLDKINQALNQLKTELGLPRLPKLIEGYDISNIQGTNAVGSMVVFKDGLPAKNLYRKFKIREKNTPDDFAMMQEMLSRRLEKIQEGETTWAAPDLIVIDGGKGQLNAALKALKAKQQTLPVIGLAKRIEEIFLPGQKTPLVLDHQQPALQLLQRLRDEAHRFGLAYHRQLRSQQFTHSALDEIPGVGPKTKKLLKQYFGTLDEIRRAEKDKLTALVGKKLAEKLKLLL